MFGLRKGSQITGILMLAILCGTGCSTLPSSGIDPSGESIFLGSPPSNPFASLGNETSSTTYVPRNYNWVPGTPVVCNPSPCAPADACGSCSPSLTYVTPTPDPVMSFPQGGWLPDTSLRDNPPQLGKSSGPKLLPKPLLGESYDKYPDGRRKWDNTGVIVRPGRVVAPVGSQVIVAAGVVAPDHYLSMNERVEWTLPSGGVGQFVEVEPDTWTDWFLLDFNMPRMIGPYRAVTSTSRNNLHITQGTPTTSDDMKIQRGETWVAVTSPVEGTSFVTALAPSVYGWGTRARTAIIHWVDVSWEFPAPSFAPAGGHQVLKTRLTRSSDHRPLVNWRVRYTVAGGPAAGFTPDGSRVTEVVTNQNGEAIVELAEQQAISGNNQICIEVIRPDGVGDCGECGVEGAAISVGKGSTTVTWSAPELAVTKIGPPAVVVGGTLTYRINVSNPGDLPTDDVQIVDEIPAGTEYIDSSPSAQLVGSSLQWRLGRLNPGETRTVQVRLRALQSGKVSSCAEATAVGGLAATGCATTNVGSPKLEVKIEGPPAARLGDIVQFDIYVINRSQVPATNLTIVDRFDEGLVSDIPHAMDRREITKQLNDIQPGRPSRIEVKFQTTKTGRFCHEVTITDGSGNRTTAQGCVDVSPAMPVDTGATSPAVPSGPSEASSTPEPPALGGYRPEVQPREVGRPQVRIEKTGPAQAAVGEKVMFDIVVQNVGDVELTNLKIVDNYDSQLGPLSATGGYSQVSDQNAVLWDLPSLPPRMKKKFQIQCNTLGPVGRACNRVRVTTDQGVEDTSEACIQIVQPASPGGTTGPATGGVPGYGGTSGLPTQPSGGAMGTGNLVMRVYDDRDAVSAGKYVNYDISVTNRSASPDRNVTLVVDVSPLLMPVRIGSVGPDGMTKPNINGQQVSFAPVAEVRPGETLSYRLRVQANTPGAAGIHATVSSQTVPKVEVREETQVNAAR